jgi:hypothetical protein
MRNLVIALALLLPACGEPDPLLHLRDAGPEPWVLEGLEGDLPPYGLALVVTPERLRIAPIGSFEDFAEMERPTLEAVAELPLPPVGYDDEGYVDSHLLPTLYEPLLVRVEAWKAAAELAGDPEREFTGELWLLVDRQLDYDPLRQVLYTAGQAQFSGFRMVSFGSAATDGSEHDDIPSLQDIERFSLGVPSWRPDGRVGLRHARIPVGKRAAPGEPEDEPEPGLLAIDDRGATFTISAPRDDELSPIETVDPRRMNRVLKSDASNPRLYPSFAAAVQGATHPVLPSLELLLHVSKRADDRLMVALERHQAPGRAAWIEAMLRAALAASEPETAAWLAAAALLGGQDPGAWGAPAEVLAAARQRVGAFEARPRRSSPLGIHGEAADLRAIFARDRFLLSPLDTSRGEDRAVALGLHTLLEGDPALAEPLRWDQARQAMLENPSRVPGVLELDPQALPREVWLLPPATSREAELMESLGGTALAPRGPMQAFADAVKGGRVSLSPREDSGWYDYQQWALEPLLTLPEAAVLEADAGYIERLERAFEAAIALRRETHIKSLQLPPIGQPQVTIVPVDVAPELRVEPLPTHYERSAIAYDFLFAAVLEPHTGEAWEAWEQGGVATDLRRAQRLYRDAAAIARADLGLDPGDGDPVEQTAAWLAGWRDDPGLAQDLRAMVPFGETLQGEPIAWAVLGVRTIDITVAYDEPPKVRSLDPRYELDVSTVPTRYTLPVLVFAELPVAEILDRAAFRALADAHPGQADLLRALAPAPSSRGCPREGRDRSVVAP